MNPATKEANKRRIPDKGDVYLAEALRKLGLKKVPDSCPRRVFVVSGDKVTEVRARRLPRF